MKMKRRLKALLLILSITTLMVILFTGCGKNAEKNEDGLGNGWKTEKSMKVSYAKEFAVDYYKGGYKLIRLKDGSRYLLVPEGKKAPKDIDEKITIIQQPLDNIYLAASASMCLFDSLDSIDKIKFSGAERSQWSIPSAAAAMDQGKIKFAGKYNNPDYEMLMGGNCEIAIENTMINHDPDVKKKIEEFGIPVFTDLSSMENHPLGRLEWIKVYGAMLNKEDQAEKFFNEQKKIVDKIHSSDTGKTVAFFTILPSGQVMVRKSGDYVTKMISMAGGKYVFSSIGDPNDSRATVTIDMEEFYKEAKNADILIYNGTIDGEITSTNQLLAINPAMKDFKAVKNGNLWSTGENMYQQATSAPQMIKEMNLIFTGRAGTGETLQYFRKVS